MITPLHQDLVFHGPLSEERAARLIASLDVRPGERVLDLGCGWAELLLRVLEAQPGATGIGVDLAEDDIEHARALAASRGLAERTTFVVGDAAAWSGEPVDVAVNLGASHVFGGDPAEHTARTLAAYAQRLAPGGRLLLGEGFWRTPPSAAAMEFFGGDTGQYGTLAELVELAQEHGYRTLAVSEASIDEWDEFQFGYLRGYERLLLDHPDDAETRAKSDQFRTTYLGAWRGVLGMAYLTLVRPRA
ncbi:SAM-dependent methyltransferase [Labedaea rhizosphaerae]|uniref:Methyltransferase family protein n=1 Tax=Labedaea rhizosphaerae TaxID=598644 RepID=A0A4R6SCT1_LABRH|nr:methyltransferase domain-containing protein [Labedaea rhizosphaerae]TDP97474.1 methyltransferase family protein [Labedaea rhizosphaerae]